MFKSLPSLVSCGVGSQTCQPSKSEPRSGRLIQHSTQTWKFLVFDKNKKKSFRLNFSLLHRNSCSKDKHQVAGTILQYLLSFLQCCVSGLLQVRFCLTRITIQVRQLWYVRNICNGCSFYCVFQFYVFDFWIWSCLHFCNCLFLA